MLVVLRVVAHIVDAVEYAAELELVFADYRVKSVGKIRIFNLFGIGGAYGRESFAALDGTFHEVYAVIVFHKPRISSVNIEEVA